jgi:pimeloyl-ACP methyl ester carboxylesterase
MDHERFRIKTPGGINIAISRRGSGPITCIFFHGLAEGGYIWDDVRDAIGAPFSTITIDLRGHGDSDWAKPGEYNLQHYVSDIEFALTSLNIGDYILIGHSLGGSIITQAWDRMPVGLRGLAIVDVPVSSNPEMLAMLRQRIRQNYREYNSTKEYAEFLRGSQPLLGDRAATYISRSCLAPTPRGTFRPKFDVEVVDNDFDKMGEWPQQFYLCNLPILVIRGAGSAVLSKLEVDKIARRLRKVTLKTVAMAGHAIMSENPAGFRNAIIPFLQSFGALKVDPLR